jgi:23S rRNA pseudouridine2605 synthase
MNCVPVVGRSFLRWKAAQTSVAPAFSFAKKCHNRFFSRAAGRERAEFPRQDDEMTKEQLQAARAAHWRQQQNPILTVEDAEGWLEQHPLCLYLPRQAQLPAPAPSFVEACMGSNQATPDMAAIERARDLMARLTGSGSAVPLNLLGGVGEQPDFLASRQALPFVVVLRAEADWKHAPQRTSGRQVSPLVLELWKALDSEGALTAAEAREKLGRELTEAAVLRGLGELWQVLRIVPVHGAAGEPAHWELLRMRYRDALTTAASTGQVTALSLLVSMYLQSVYAATGEEIEIFLSPAASRSRIREAVRGLSATRQIHSLSMDAQTYYFLENGLPEFAEPAIPVTVQEVEPPRPPRPIPSPYGGDHRRPERPARPAPMRPAQPPAAATEWRARPAAAQPGRRPPQSPEWGTRAGRPSAGPQGKPGEKPATWSEDRRPSRPGTRPERRSAGPRDQGAFKDRPFRPSQRPRPDSRPPAPDAPPGGVNRERFSGRPTRPFRPGSRPGGERPQGTRPTSEQGGSQSRPFRASSNPRPASPSMMAAGGPRGTSRERFPGRPSRPFRPGSRPSGERPQGARPQGTRPQGTRPQGARPQGTRPQGTRPQGTRPQGTRPQGTRPQGTRPQGTRPQGTRPQGTRPQGTRPQGTRPQGTRPQGTRPFSKGRGGPPKSWPRGGASAGRPGRRPDQPSARFRGPKPDRKKPEV